MQAEKCDFGKNSQEKLPSAATKRLKIFSWRTMSLFLESEDESFSEEPLLQSEGARDRTGPDLLETEQGGSWWSYLTFSWVSPIMDAGSKRRLDYCDLFPLPEDMSAVACCSGLFNCWEEERHKDGSGHPSLFRALFATYGRAWLFIGIIKIINDSLSFTGPLFLNKIVTFLESGNDDLLYGYYCAAGIGLVSVIRAFLGAHYTFLICRLRVRVKASITTIVYQKALCVSLSERTTFSSGEIQTFMSVDAERIANLVNCAHDIWSLPLQMGVALWMLYTQVKFAFVAGLSVIILLIPVNKWIATFICTANESMMKEKDERVRRMGEILIYIRTLKMYTWENFFLRRVMQSREQELKFLAIKKYLDACCVYLWACTPSIFSLLTFGLFVLLGYTLTAATVFTCLALFNILISPLNSFPWVVNGVIEARVSMARLCKLLCCSEIDSNWTKEILRMTTGRRQPTAGFNDKSNNDHKKAIGDSKTCENIAVKLETATFTWSHSLVENPASIITRISLAIPQGSLVVVLGKVGSGKSSFLEAILGEMRCLEGSVIVQGRLGYVPQSPWIQAGTVCSNILFGQPYVADRYTRILEACALDVDIQKMRGGDSAEIGERGVNLSGGQRARLALARLALDILTRSLGTVSDNRALYQDRDVYLLDDPLSAVDAHVAAWLMEHAISGQHMISKTRILCTHHAQAISFADIVVMMEGGKVTHFGNLRSDLTEGSQSLNLIGAVETAIPFDLAVPPDLLSGDVSEDISVVPVNLSSPQITGTPPSVLNKNPQYVPQPRNSEMLDCGSPQQNQLTLKSKSTPPVLESLQTQQSPRAKPVKLVEDEDRLQGHVQATVYRAYGSFVNWSVIATILVSISLMQATRNGSDLWLAHWVDTTADAPGEHSRDFYLKIYVTLAISNSVVTLSRAFSFAYGGMRAAAYVHRAFLQKIISAPVRFFDQNPSGRILNRFASDQYIIDDSLPFVVNNLLAQSFNLIGIGVILCLVQWTFLIVLIPIAFIYNILQNYYRATSRELRRLDGVSRSPIYTSFSEVLEGAATIRAFKAQAQFSAMIQDKIDLNLRASFSELCASLWLSIRLQVLAAMLMLLISILAVFTHNSDPHIRPLSAGLVGLGLSYASPIITTLNNLLAHFTETEKDMVSMERIQQYMDLEAEPHGGNSDVPPDWPAYGAIEFCKVTLYYLPSLPPALHELSFSIRPGEKVGIVGRTGAGKSSILSVLFRLTTISEGRVMIDGVNSSSISLQLLRSRLSVVPQTPMLFEGPLRQNLDPSGTINDRELWNMLEKCHMKSAVTGVGGLDLYVSEGGESLSLGQRQLLCLSRALLSCGQILCLDECTANIDPETTTLLMKTVTSECKDMTVITIAHRITTILNLDRVLILDHGSLVEDGEPQKLLANRNSRFAALVMASGASSEFDLIDL